MVQLKRGLVQIRLHCKFFKNKNCLQFKLKKNKRAMPKCCLQVQLYRRLFHFTIVKMINITIKIMDDKNFCLYVLT